MLLDPDTGAVLALASWPTFDPNRFARAPTSAAQPRAVDRRLRAGLDVQDGHRRGGARSRAWSTPTSGSTARWAASRWPASASPTTRRSATLSFREVIAKSSNVGTIKTALRVANSELLRPDPRLRLRPADRHRPARREPRPADAARALAGARQGLHLVRPGDLGHAAPARRARSPRSANGGRLLEPYVVAPGRAAATRRDVPASAAGRARAPVSPRTIADAARAARRP